ncbi:MAG: MAPEG family protein [Gammaproteobacteria bacterium]|nr:MAPEG family protein [Gammaproteobacteria bacterium]
MAYVTVIVMLALVEYLYFGVAVGGARGRHGVAAPAVSGNELFERFYRAHQNTLEQLVVFIPAMFGAAYYVHELLAVAAGVTFLVGRAWYFRAYISTPAKRAGGMILTMLANVTLVIATIVGALRVGLS